MVMSQDWPPIMDDDVVSNIGPEIKVTIDRHIPESRAEWVAGDRVGHAIMDALASARGFLPDPIVVRRPDSTAVDGMAGGK